MFIFITQFAKKFSDKCNLAKERSLDNACFPLFESIAKKYENSAAIDKLTAVLNKVESVKIIMQENVDLALQNCVKLETIQLQAGINQVSSLK